MRKLALYLFLAAVNLAPGLVLAQATVSIEPFRMLGPRLLQAQTRESVMRDYLRSWQSVSLAFDHNSPEMLDQDFVGTAKEKLAGTIESQKRIGIHTRYLDHSHRLQIVFYSPDGQSLELTDRVDYDLQMIDRNATNTTQHMSAMYIVILTPTETRWRVRVFQAVPQE